METTSAQAQGRQVRPAYPGPDEGRVRHPVRRELRLVRGRTDQRPQDPHRTSDRGARWCPRHPRRGHRTARRLRDAGA
ncbi:hypothetical protein G5V59_07355 [Nocardioides sp. W3-2-3]|uniref:hypothetical protein n=1 Tax=Nocardioides convexus TaxID=2712224 RepID=UPI0024185681|nr:hypothetical protein [Nocardioides convexus]NHA00061.1 hypothetical protein [Nocardioides convexus]